MLFEFQANDLLLNVHEERGNTMAALNVVKEMVERARRSVFLAWFLDSPPNVFRRFLSPACHPRMSGCGISTFGGLYSLR